MSRRSFFAKRLPFFGNRAMLILCAVFFLLPFVLRGARESVDGIKNDVADWLPSSFSETAELKIFRDYFIGDQFVVVSWDGCTERDSRFNLVLQKLMRESVEGEALERKRLAAMDPETEEYQLLKEELEARDWGTDLALQTTGNYYENWGEHNEKWLQGKDKQWYFIRQDGSVFKWNGQNNLIDAGSRGIKRFLNGKNEADGTFIKRFGKMENNRFYEDPSLLSARFFVDITTGPSVYKRMAEDTMLQGEYKGTEKAAFEAAIETHKRLTGVLFGPTPDPEFDWTLNSFLQVIPHEERAQIDKPREFEFQAFVDELVEKEYGGDIAGLKNAPQSQQLEHWYRLFNRLGVAPPPRQTCLVVTLNDPVLEELARVVGRPVLGKPRGRIHEIATGQCGITADNLHIGGPPVDNVAIDEEGSITLFRLVGLSAFIGLTLAYLSFRSIRVTLMLFFVGGVAAIASLAFVWFLGGTMDAILMTMPSLVYVLGLSGAVHVVNYYRDACHEHGEGRAADIAVRQGLFPCALAAFTTALGLISLCTSNLTPINKFGFYSAIATIATVVLLFTYLPSSLTIWSPGYGKRRKNDLETGKQKFSITIFVEKFWEVVGAFVLKHNKLVVVTGLILMATFAIGITRIQTSVQLLKLFRNDAKILRDYRWMEDNLGKLVPMEVVLKVDGDSQIFPTDPTTLTQEDLKNIDFKLSFLQRMELSDRVRRYILQVFGDESRDEDRRYIGNVMSTDLAVPLNVAVKTQLRGPGRFTPNGELENNRDALLEEDYLRVDPDSLEELWRISLRLAALNNVDYGQFVGELKTVVEPCVAAYRYRLKILKAIHSHYDTEQQRQGSLLVIGPAPAPRPRDGDPPALIGLTDDMQVDQTGIFVNTLYDLVENAGFREKREQTEGRKLKWTDPAQLAKQPSAKSWKALVSDFDCVLVIGNPPVDMDLVRENAKSLVVADDYRFEIDPETKNPMRGMMTAAERKASGDEEALISTSYTGIVPIVYKAQRSLLVSLIKSICLAFVMIAIVMMLLLRSWGRRTTLGNALNFRAGMIAMIPNVFPIVLIFGFMGHAGRLVDIGSMMTASVAMGVAVDDTIHFLNWFRKGLGKGLDRIGAIKLAYSKVATAMTQTTLIGGFGLSAFAFSTFMPTQRFGVLMLFLLIAALIGDLILLPAILAGPLGKYFCNVDPKASPANGLEDELYDDEDHHEDESNQDDGSPDLITFQDNAEVNRKRAGGAG